MARVTGTRELQRRLKGMRDEVARVIQPSLVEAAGVVMARQKQLVPVKTGALRDSIVARPETGKDAAILITAGGGPVQYADDVEFGTTSRPAQPYFFAGYHEAKKRAGKIIRDAMHAAIKRGR
jgi:HK97 gp10 family phage protein